MADNLIFPIGFDLDSAVKKAAKEWDDTYASRLEKAIQKRAIAVKIKFDTSKLDNLDAVRRRLAQLKIEPITPETKTAIRELAKELQTLAKALEQVQKFSTTNRLSQQNFRNDMATERLRQANERLEIQKRRVTLAEQKHAEAMRRSATASQKLSKEYQSQDGYISRLLKRMAVYAGYSAIGGFLRNVREVTAEFELQRVSLGAIIQDQQRANQLFAEIKTFALTSPLKILDLTKYTKQVAAYGIETEKVFDTTKMLADISVGLGVSLDRLALFYGQVFATGYLRASEVRQATEAGIPLVDKLAAKLSEANGKLVTAADVIDLISKRAISFEQVEEVFQDMTSAGGEFYNMQVKQSQTLFGMWSKLGDAAALMYDEIGNTSSVNAGMKATLGLLESLMRNWKTTARVLDTVGVALGVYVIGLKNAAVASKTVTVAEGARLAITKAQVIATPKLVAAIIGQNAATKLSATLTKAHTVAMLKHATATNVLTKGFWKLTAAMLANPWVAAAAAIAAVGAALFLFIGNTETAEERVEKLNNSVASLKNLKSEVDPLIEAYTELANKTQRTTEEQRKLNETAQQLAQRFPAAIEKINEYGREVGLAADEVARLYANMKQVKTENVKSDIEKSEKYAEKLLRERETLSKYLEGGKMWSGGGGTGGGGGAMVAMSEKERTRVLGLIGDLDKKILEITEDITEAKREIGEMPSEAAQAVEKFGAWKKELRTFRIEIEKGKSIQLFDDSTIEQFKSLDEAMKQTAKDYKEQTELAERYDKALAKMSATADSRAKVEQARAEATARANEDMAVLTRFGYKPSDFDKSTGGTRSDNSLSILQEMVSTIKQVNKEYDELAKKEGTTKALADTQEKYANTFKYLQSLATEYEFNLPDFGVPTDAKSLTKYLEAIKTAMAKVPESEKAVLSLETDIADINLADAQRTIDAQLKALADRISRTKTAREFYDKILGMTGDVELAANVSMSIYGETGFGLQEQLADQIRQYFQNDNINVEIPVDVITSDNQINYKKLGEFAEKYKEQLGEKPYEAVKKIAEEGKKGLAKTYEGYLKDLEKAKSYSDKRIELARYTANKIAEINASTLPQEEKERRTAGYKEREAKEAAKLEYEAFKDTPMYVQMFADLDNASTTMLRNMQSMLTQLKGKWGEALDPTQLKEMQSRLNEIGEQLARRNPFKAIGEGIGKIRALNKQYGSLKNVETELSTATKSLLDNKDALTAALQAETAARESYNKAVAESGADSAEAKSAQSDWTAATTLVNTLRKSVNLSEEEVKLLQEIIDKFKEANDEVDDGFKGIGEYVAKVKEAQDAIKGAMEEWTTLGDDELWNAIFDGLDKMAQSAEQGGEAVAAYFQGDYFTMVTKGISSVANLVSGIGKIFWGSKIAKANKEIERQQELLDQLEYTYGRLQNASDKLFGRDYINNYNQQMKNLEAQAAAYRKQAEAERSKGKKEDEEKTKEYENSYRDTMDAIADMQGELTAHFTGTTRQDAAREFAQSWFEAKASFASTTDAIKSKYKDMIKDMIIEGAAARIIENALAPIWEQMDAKLGKNDVYGAIDALVYGMDTFIADADNGLNVLWESLEARGYDMKKLLGDTDTNLTGISRDIASASEESINGLATGINTQNYYISHVPQIAADVAAMRAMLDGGATAAALPASPAGWTDWQQQAMDNYVAIQRNTADAVVECRRIAERCTAMAADIHRVVVPRGTKASHGVQVYM